MSLIPNPPTSLICSLNTLNRTITISWTYDLSEPSATAFLIEKKDTVNTSYSEVRHEGSDGSGSQSYVDTAIAQAGQTYTYRISCANGCGLSSSIEYSILIPCDTPDPPYIFNQTLDNCTIVLSYSSYDIWLYDDAVYHLEVDDGGGWVTLDRSKNSSYTYYVLSSSPVTLDFRVSVEKCNLVSSYVTANIVTTGCPSFCPAWTENTTFSGYYGIRWEHLDSKAALIDAYIVRAYDDCTNYREYEIDPNGDTYYDISVGDYYRFIDTVTTAVASPCYHILVRDVNGGITSCTSGCGCLTDCSACCTIYTVVLNNFGAGLDGSYTLTKVPAPDCYWVGDIPNVLFLEDGKWKIIIATATDVVSLEANGNSNNCPPETGWVITNSSLVGSSPYAIVAKNCSSSSSSSVVTCYARGEASGGDLPNPNETTITIDPNNSYTFRYQTFTVKDQIIVYDENDTVLFDTGCVGTGGPAIYYLNLTTDTVKVSVIPDCDGGSGTAWWWSLICESSSSSSQSCPITCPTCCEVYTVHIEGTTCIPAAAVGVEDITITFTDLVIPTTATVGSDTYTLDVASLTGTGFTLNDNKLSGTVTMYWDGSSEWSRMVPGITYTWVDSGLAVRTVKTVISAAFSPNFFIDFHIANGDDVAFVPQVSGYTIPTGIFLYREFIVSPLSCNAYPSKYTGVWDGIYPNNENIAYNGSATFYQNQMNIYKVFSQDANNCEWNTNGTGIVCIDKTWYLTVSDCNNSGAWIKFKQVHYYSDCPENTGWVYDSYNAGGLSFDASSATASLSCLDACADPYSVTFSGTVLGGYPPLNLVKTSSGQYYAGYPTLAPEVYFTLSRGCDGYWRLTYDYPSLPSGCKFIVFKSSSISDCPDTGLYTADEYNAADCIANGDDPETVVISDIPV